MILSDAPRAELEPGIRERGHDPVRRLPDHHVRQAHGGEGGEPGREMHFDRVGSIPSSAAVRILASTAAPPRDLFASPSSPCASVGARGGGAWGRPPWP